MNIRYKVLDNDSQVYRYVKNLQDTVKVDTIVFGGYINNFEVVDKVGLTDDFQLIRNVEIILRTVEQKICSLSSNQSLLVYVEEYSDKYLFIRK